MHVNFRNATSSTATDHEVIQANAFAAELLMPAAQVRACAKAALEGRRASDAALVRDLADGFDVSEQAMEYRLVNLGWRRQV